MAKLVSVGRKLAMVGRKLVTDEGGAPCCCGTLDGCSVSCTQTVCKQCATARIVSLAPFYFNNVTSDPGERAAFRLALDEMYSGFQCAQCKQTKVVIPPWSYTITDDFGITVSVTFLDEIRLCSVISTAPPDGAQPQDWSQSSGMGTARPQDITWLYANYGMGYSDGFRYWMDLSLYPPEGKETAPVCLWSDIGQNGETTIDPSRVRVTLRAKVDEHGNPINLNQTAAATRVNVTAALYQASEYVARNDSPLWREFVGGVILVVQYSIDSPFGSFFLVPSPPANADESDRSPLVDIRDWGGWVSCKKVRVVEFSPGFGVAAMTQSYKACTPTSVCGSKFKPVGVTIVPELGGSYTWTSIDGTYAWHQYAMYYQWPTDNRSWTSFSSTGFEAEIVDEYGASCSDPPPGEGLLGMV